MLESRGVAHDSPLYRGAQSVPRAPRCGVRQPHIRGTLHVPTYCDLRSPFRIHVDSVHESCTWSHPPLAHYGTLGFGWLFWFIFIFEVETGEGPLPALRSSPPRRPVTPSHRTFVNLLKYQGQVPPEVWSHQVVGDVGSSTFCHASADRSLTSSFALSLPLPAGER